MLDTLLELHGALGRSGPAASERVRFAIDGLRVRIAPSRRKSSPRHFASPASLAPDHAFDQGNGVVEDARPLSEREQVRGNAAAGSNSDEQHTAPLAWFGLHAQSQLDRRQRRR